MLAAAWPLFQVSLPGCLPLALVGVAASGTPGAQAIVSGEGHGFVHSGQWWGLYAASTVLMLICYGGILRQQLAHAAGRRLGVLDSMRLSVAGLPATFVVLLVMFVAVLGGGIALVLPGYAALVWLYFAWTAQIDEHLGPLAALRRSIALVRGRFLAVAGIVGATLAAVLVFVLLTGVLLAVVMSLAGPRAQTSQIGLAVSRWLMAALLSLPVVYLGAVGVAAWRTALNSAPATRGDPAPQPER